MNNLTERKLRPGDDFIEAEIPTIHRSLFPKVLAAAYKAVDELVKETPFLQCPPAKIADGHLVAWAVDYGVSRLIESGQWPVEGYEWASFKKPTGKYLRIFTKRSIISISQLPDFSQQPRYAEFRANAVYDEQVPLFLLPGERDLSSFKHQRLLLVHGYHKLDFIHFVMPNPEMKPAWLGDSGNLFKEIYIVDSNLTPAEGPGQVAMPTIKEEIKRQIRDHAS
jgi:hypothetical protein